MKRPFISIISPCFNEEENIHACYSAVKELFDTGGPLNDCDYEHIFVDNSSTDRTVPQLRGIASTDGRVRIIVNSRNYGPFRSTFNALRYASGDAVVPMFPVDLQDPAELIATFVKKWQEGFLRVYGIRSQRAEGPVMRFARAAYYRLANRLSNIELTPGVAEFQLLDRSIVVALLRYRDHYPYMRGIIADVGFAAESLGIEYRWAKRRSGLSKNQLSNLVDQGLNGIISTTSTPFRFPMIIGFLFSFLSSLYICGRIVYFVISENYTIHGTEMVIVVMFFLSGAQLFMLGLLGEYVASIHSQVRRGDIVVEREVINMPKLDPDGREVSASRPPRSSNEA